MALFNTLKQILTPYANKINLHTEEIEEIQSDVSEVKADLGDTNGMTEVTGWLSGKNVILRTAITSVNINTDIVDQTGFSCVILPCSEGDVFYITSKGASGARNWAFLSSDGTDGNNNIILRAVAGANNYRYTNERIIAPIGTKYIVLNAHEASPRKVIKGEYLCNAVEQNRRSISILFVGNSLTQDGIAYLPYILKTYYPEIEFRFYIWYQGGYTLAQHHDKFVNDQTCSIFSVAENESAWTNYDNSKTMADILSTYKFNVVCLQEYFNYKSSYVSADLADWTNCKDYIQSHYTGGNGLEFISLFHAPLRASADSVFALTKTGNALILQDTIAQDMIPNGIAVYRALNTALDSLGDQGHLSPDGTHTQEGLPCLLQTYVSLCWLFDRLGISKSICGCPMRITTSIYNKLNVPGANLGTGVITGTDAENLLAQEVAIQAHKEGKWFVMNNIYSES